MQVFRNWVTLPDVAPAVGWPIFILLVLLYFTTNFLLLGALFLGIGAQASNIREIQTISMPVTMLQLSASSSWPSPGRAGPRPLALDRR